MEVVLTSLVTCLAMEYRQPHHLFLFHYCESLHILPEEEKVAQVISNQLLGHERCVCTGKLTLELHAPGCEAHDGVAFGRTRRKRQRPAGATGDPGGLCDQTHAASLWERWLVVNLVCGLLPSFVNMASRHVGQMLQRHGCRGNFKRVKGDACAVGCGWFRRPQRLPTLQFCSGGKQP